MSKNKKILLVATILLLSGIALMIAAIRWFPQFEEPEPPCEHEQYQNGVCVKCGYVCKHEMWRAGVCLNCGLKCKHQWNAGRCVVCGLLCEHKEYADGVCTNCGYVCKHIKYENGKCVTCGYQCKHNWKGSICSLCKMKCVHEDHDKDSQVCFTCLQKVSHHFVNGVCSCGQPIEFVEKWAFDGMFNPCDEPGTVENVSYQAPSFEGEFDGIITKNMSIYLPYNYNPDGKYDVLIMYHGGGADELSWTTEWHRVEFVDIQMKNMYDNMIAKKLCNPLIIVSPATGTTSITGDELQDVSINQNSAELEKIVLPYIVEHYATYAKDSTPESIKEARAHFGIGGDSNGSLFAYNCGFLANYEYFANYACFSGDNCSEQIAEMLQQAKYDQLEFGYYYAGAGETDSQRNRTRDGFNLICASTDKLRVGENAAFQVIKGGHDWKTFSLSTYNALRVLFPATGSK